MDLMLQSHNPKKVAEVLGISVRTVEEHLGHVREKMGVETTAQALILFRDWRLSQPEPTAVPPGAAPPAPGRKWLPVAIAGCTVVLGGIGFYLREAHASGGELPRWEPEWGAPVLIGVFRSDPKDETRLVAIQPGTWKPFAMTPPMGDSYHMAWSPDGKRIAFIVKQDGVESIWTMTSDSTGLRRLTEPTSNCDMPAYSPDSARLAFCSDVDDPGDIFEMAADGGPWKRLAASGGEERWPAYSHDGKELAFASNRDRGFDIYVLRFADGKERRLTASKGDTYHLGWRRDDGMLSFITNWDGNWEIYTVRPDGGDLRRITHTREFGEGNPSWLGESLLFDRCGAEDTDNRSLWFATPTSSPKLVCRLPAGGMGEGHSGWHVQVRLDGRPSRLASS
jgi:hypothetical protein